MTVLILQQKKKQPPKQTTQTQPQKATQKQINNLEKNYLNKFEDVMQ